MKKLSILLGMVLLLAACGGAPAPDGAADAGESDGLGAAVDTTAVSAVLGDPFVLREGDYFKGAEDPTFTIIEYGDFQ